MPNETIKISIIVPVYQAEQYLPKCVDSLLAQSYKNYEIILVEDGATDGSPKLCDKYAEENPCVKVVHQENRGAAAARNRGIEAASGDYVAFVDSDDTVSEDYLSFLIKLAEKYQADIAVCGYTKVYEGKEAEPVQSKSTRKLILSGVEAMENLLYQKDFMSVPWGMISKRELWNHVSFPEGTRAEDMGTVYRLFAEAKKLVYQNEAKYYYYQRSSSTIYTTENVLNPDFYKHSSQMVSFVKANYTDRIGAAYSRHLSSCFKILSETDITPDTKELCDRVTRDIKLIRGYVLRDSKAKKRNRGAAALSKVIGIPAMHKMLRAQYKRKVAKL